MGLVDVEPLIAHGDQRRWGGPTGTTARRNHAWRRRPSRPAGSVRAAGERHRVRGDRRTASRLPRDILVECRSWLLRRL